MITCLWRGSPHRTPARVVLARDLDQAKACTLALATTDLTTPGGQIMARYASRWPAGQPIKDGQDLPGAGDARNRLPAAAERTTPPGLASLTILVRWYDLAGRPAAGPNTRRQAAPWYRHNRHVPAEDMIIAFRRARITGNTAAQDTPALFDAPTPATQATAA